MAEATAGRVRIGIAVKIVGAVAASAALVALLLAWSFARQVRGILEEDLRTRGEVAAVTLANNAPMAIFARDRVGLGDLGRATVRDTPGIAYVLVRDEAGAPLVRAGADDLSRIRDEALPAAPDAPPDEARTVQRTLDVAGRSILEVTARVLFEEGEHSFDPLQMALGATKAARAIGSVQVGLDLATLDARIAGATRRAMGVAALAFLACIAAVLPFVRFLTVPLARLSAAAAGVAKGDLAQDVRATDGGDEVSEVARSFETMVAELRSALLAIRDVAAELHREAEATADAASQQAEVATAQATTLHQISAAVHEIAQVSGQVTGHAKRVIDVSAQAEDHAEQGRTAVSEAVTKTTDLGGQVSVIAKSVGELSAQAERIHEVASNARDLAQESNVVALNAAIEASRAGEHGRGFSVVAREMHRLSEQSGKSAVEVRDIVAGIQRRMQAAVHAAAEGASRATAAEQLAQSAGQTIVDLSQICRDSAVAAREIATSARQQHEGVNEIVTALAAISESAARSAKGNERLKQVAEQLKAASGRLGGLVSQYRL